MTDLTPPTPPSPASPADARAWYDTVYQPWVTGAIGGVMPMGGSDSLFGPARSIDPVTGKEAASAGILDAFDPSNWMAPWDFLMHLDEMWDNFWDHIGTLGCGCVLVILFLPCIIPWALIVLVAVALGARPLMREKGTPAHLGHASQTPDPLPHWLLERGIIRDLSAPPSQWSAVTQHAAQQGISPKSWSPPLAYRMAASDPSRDWYQAQVRQDIEGGRVQLWTILVWPDAALANPPTGSSLHTLPDRSGYAVVTHPVITLGFSASPVSWQELEAYLGTRT